MRFAQLESHAAEVIRRTLAELPKEIRPHAEGVIVLYERAPDESVLAEGFEPDILGLFQGRAFGTEFSSDDPRPPQILLYLPSLWDYAAEDLGTFREEVRITFLHELGHYFGWGEEDVAARGLE